MPGTQLEALPGLSPGGRSLLSAVQEVLEQGAFFLAEAGG